MSELTLDAIIAHIVGRRIGTPAIQRRDHVELGEPVLTLEHVSGAFKPKDVSLALHRGEILGIAGLLGSGRSSLARVISGIDPIFSGEIRVGGRLLRMAGARDALAAGIALIPEDRVRQGLVIEHSLASNICLPVLDRLTYWSWLSPSKATHLAEDQIAKLRIKSGSSENPVRTLSGGNQQKVVLAKWLAADPDILVLDEPTAGIDVGSKSEIVALVRELARGGKAIILISSELSELLAACDRIAVMANGRLVRDIPRGELDPAVEDGSAEDAEHQLQVAVQMARVHV
jgi:ribose transport system ATP-binding protein